MIEKIEHIDKIITDEWEWVNILKKYAYPDEADVIRIGILGRKIIPFGYDDYEIEYDDITDEYPHYDKEQYKSVKFNVNYKEFYRAMRFCVWCTNFSRDNLKSKIIENVARFISNNGDIQSKIMFQALLNRIEMSNNFLTCFINYTQKYLKIKSRKPKAIIEELLAFNKNLYERLYGEYSFIFPEFFKKQEEIIIIPQIPDEAPYKSNIFRSQEAENWFNEKLDEFNVSDGGRGFGAVIAAIFRDNDCKKHILKGNLIQRKYIEYLNDRFNKTMNTTNLSNSDNYANEIEKHIKNYINSLSE